MGTELTDRSGEPNREPTLSAARLAVAARRARTEVGAKAAMLLSEPIAIVGMGCRFPGGVGAAADTPEAYWRMLAEGRSGIRELPEERWTEARKTMPPELLLGGYLDGVDEFDAEFFGIAPREAHSIDPQQRLLLEVCWEALADGGYAPGSLSGTETGVFVAIYNTDYSRLQMREGAEIDAYTGVGSAHSVAAGRISFLLNLRGPCLAVDTACSSSLVAAHLACQSLRQRECNVALVGGSSLKLLADEVRTFAQWGMLASDGQAKTFDARADGFAAGEGCGVIVLKRLSDAVAQGDRIRGVIRGSAVNHDGRSSVLTAPNGPAQEAVIRAALKDGQLSAGDVSYVEAHGTGTSLGDPIEVEALDAVYGAVAGPDVVLGAVKTNFGHLEAAAGVAGLIKVVLALENQAIPKNLNFGTLNPQIVLGPKSRLRLAMEAKNWPRAAASLGQPRFAGVSSFGLGGTNAHLILEEAPLLPRTAEPAGLEFCLAVSAHTAEGLAQGLGDYAALLREPGADLAAVAKAAARGRDHGAFRVAVTGATAAEVAEKLESRLAARLASSSMPESADAEFGKLGFVFSGQGSLWPGMLAALVEQFPVAEKTIAECEGLIQAAAGWSLREVAADAAQLEDTAKAQPVLFAMQMALVRVLESWGVAPEAVCGHSVGEVAAAVAAGALTLDEGMRLVLRRGARMGTPVVGQEPGRMLAAEMSEAAARALLAAHGGGVELAAVNGPLSVVFAGAEAALTGLVGRLSGEQLATRWLDVKYAFHSAAMDGAARALEADLRVEFAAGRRGAVPLVSTVSGEVWRAGSGDGDAAYWARGIRQPVLFRAGVGKLLEMGCRTVVEIGPHPVLLRSVAACAAEANPEKVAAIAVMRRGQSARATLMAAVGLLYERGCELDWKKVYPGPMAHVALPPYRWSRKRYWLAEGPARTAAIPARFDEGEGDLPSREVSSAFVEGRLLESSLGTVRSPWLADHCFQGTPLLPFTAWLEMARRAGAAGDAGGELREFAVHRRLELGAEAVALQTLITKSGEIKLAGRLSSELGAGWETVASGFWESAAGSEPGHVDLDTYRARATERIAPEDIYRELEAKGLTYGPAFRLLRGLVAGPGFALGEVSGPLLPGVVLHPAMLDACLQGVPAALGAGMQGGAVLPVSVRSYRVLRAAGEAFALVEARGDGSEVDVTVVEPAGLLVAKIRGLRVRRVEAGKAPAATWRVVWEPVADAGVEVMPDVTAGPVVLRGGLEEVTHQLLDLVAQEQKKPGSVLRVCIVTRGACAVYPGERVDAEQAAVWGLGRSFRAEYPGIAVQLIDLPLGGAGLGEAAMVDGWIAAAGAGSQEVALRQGRWLRSRLEAFQAAEAAGETALVVGTPGLLETLHEEAAVVGSPGPGEVQIAVRAHGLNFRDVLTALGNYAGMAGEMGAECSGVVVRAGVLAGVDAGFPAGAEVVAFVGNSMRSVVNVPVTHVFAKPQGMTFAEAATVPVAFLTAHYGFSRLAELRAGQTVLVHSAAGGLGQAAVQLALRAGATVLATAGSEEKRAFLRGQGLEYVFDSRSSAFADEVLAATDGRGADVVLNALSGDKIAAGFRALALGGAFLEVGKRDIWSNEQVKAARPDARYWAFDLGEVADRDPELVQAMLREIFEGFAAGELRLVPSEVYPVAEAERAFRHMASGRHVGKLVLSREPRGMASADWERALRDGTVLITGGTGALGLATARWLLGQGARSLVLMSRGGGTEAALALEGEFAGQGAGVRVEAGDVADRGQLAAVLAGIRAGGDAPLRAVFHAAGVTEDSLLADHSEESFARGMRTKVEGARLLEELTAGDDLAATVYFSSAAALLGSAGQAGYAAANAYLDGLAEERSARGLPTLSVNWGAWAEGGMVEQLSAAASARLARQGIRPMRPERALAALGTALKSGEARVAIADVDWAVFGGQFPAGSAAGEFFAEFLPQGPVKLADAGSANASAVKGPGSEDRDEIAAIVAAARSERGLRMESFVRSAARKVLGLSAGRPMPAETPMQEFGLDSLMALELRNVLGQAMGRPLSATLLFDYPSIRGLAAFLLELAVPAEVVPGKAAEPVAADEGLADLTEMTDAEAEELLLAELNRNGSGV